MASLDTRLADAASRAARAIAVQTPADVRVTWSDGAIRLTGRALSARALLDPRLRDFAAIVRTEAPR
jgi:hypothetical protein